LPAVETNGNRGGARNSHEQGQLPHASATRYPECQADHVGEVCNGIPWRRVDVETPILSCCSLREQLPSSLNGLPCLRCPQPDSHAHYALGSPVLSGASTVSERPLYVPAIQTGTLWWCPNSLSGKNLSQSLPYTRPHSEARRRHRPGDDIGPIEDRPIFSDADGACQHIPGIMGGSTFLDNASAGKHEVCVTTWRPL